TFYIPKQSQEMSVDRIYTIEVPLKQSLDACDLVATPLEPIRKYRRNCPISLQSQTRYVGFAPNMLTVLFAITVVNTVTALNTVTILYDYVTGSPIEFIALSRSIVILGLPHCIFLTNCISLALYISLTHCIFISRIFGTRLIPHHQNPN
ncbi:hypothetical protein BGX38DRAFT_1161124, partial [Terfezia claveryi]